MPTNTRKHTPLSVQCCVLSYHVYVPIFVVWDSVIVARMDWNCIVICDDDSYIALALVGHCILCCCIDFVLVALYCDREYCIVIREYLNFIGTSSAIGQTTEDCGIVNKAGKRKGRSRVKNYENQESFRKKVVLCKCLYTSQDYCSDMIQDIVTY